MAVPVEIPVSQSHRYLPDRRFLVPDVERLEVVQVDQAAIEDIELRSGLDRSGRVRPGQARPGMQVNGKQQEKAGKESHIVEV